MGITTLIFIALVIGILFLPVARLSTVIFGSLFMMLICLMYLDVYVSVKILPYYVLALGWIESLFVHSSNHGFFYNVFVSPFLACFYAAAFIVVAVVVVVVAVLLYMFVAWKLKPWLFPSAPPPPPPARLHFDPISDEDIIGDADDIFMPGFSGVEQDQADQPDYEQATKEEPIADAEDPPESVDESTDTPTSDGAEDTEENQPPTEDDASEESTTPDEATETGSVDEDVATEATDTSAEEEKKTPSS